MTRLNLILFWVFLAVILLFGSARAEMPVEIPADPPVLCLTGEYSSVPGAAIIIYANKLELAYTIIVMDSPPDAPFASPPSVVHAAIAKTGPCFPYVLAESPLFWRWGGSINPMNGVSYEWRSWVERSWR